MKIFVFLLCVLISAPAFAEEPVEVSAAGSLVWDRAAKTYTANTDAVAAQSGNTVRADKLVAFYDEATGSTDIKRIEAHGHVVISAAPYKGYGDVGVYTTATQNAVLTGQNLRIETDTQTLTAQDKVEFFAAENKMIATGNAIATRGTDKVRADVLIGYFTQDASGKRSLTKITAQGNVVITTAKEEAHGDAGVYDVAAQEAVLTGAVKLYQGQSWLEGTRATVDMRTGLAKLFADGKARGEGGTGGEDAGRAKYEDAGRVRGVFYPKGTKE